MDRSLGPKGDSSPTERERLLLERMPERLARRGRWEDLRRLLSNFTFLTDKVALFGPQALIEDCERSDDPSLRVLELALRQAAHILQDAPGQLPSHVHNLLFLFGGDDEPTRHLLAQARKALASQPWLRLLNQAKAASTYQALRRVMDHGAPLTAVALSPDGRWLAVAGEDRRLVLWNPATGEEALLRTGPAQSVNALAWSPDGLVLAAGGDDRVVRLWTVAQKRVKATCRGHGDIVEGVSWQPDGRLLASTSTSEESTVRLWDASDGRSHAILRDASGPVVWSPTGRLLVSVTRKPSGAIRVWDADSGRCRATLRDATPPLAWSPDGRVLATAGTDHRIWLWDARRRSVRSIDDAHSGDISALRWSPDRHASVLASGGKDGIVKTWDSATGAAMTVMAGHWDDNPTNVGRAGMSRPHPITGIWVNRSTNPDVEGLIWSPDGSLLASSGADATVRLWRPPAKEPVAVLRRLSSPRPSWSADGSLLALCDDKAIRLWYRATGKVADLSGHSDSVGSLSWRSDGTLLVSSGSDGTVRSWDPSTVESEPSVAGPTGSIKGRPFSPSGRMLAWSGSDGTVHVRSSTTGTQVATLPGGRSQADPVLHLTWSPRGDLLAATDARASVAYVWDLRDKQSTRTLEGHAGLLLALAWSQDGKVLATGGRDKTVRLWKPTGALLRTLEGHTGQVNAVAWSSSGETLASAGADRMIRLWNPRNGRIRSVLEVRHQSVKQLAWSPDSTLLAVAAVKENDPGNFTAVLPQGLAASVVREENRVVELWDPVGARRQATLVGATYPLAWSPDGTRLATRCYADTVAVWEVESGALERVLPGRIHRFRLLSSTWLRDEQALVFEATIDPENRLPLAWSPDGSRLATAGGEISLQVWDTHEEITVVEARCLSPVRGLKFHEDGIVLLAADDGTGTGNQPLGYCFGLVNVVGEPPVRRKQPGHRRRQHGAWMRSRAGPAWPYHEAVTRAEGLCERLLPILTEALGPGHPKVLEAIADLARAYEALGDDAQAGFVCRQALSVLERTADGGDPTLVSPLNDMAGICERHARYGDAEALRTRALAIAGAAGAATIVSTLVGLANLYCDHLDRYADAESRYRRAVEIARDHLEPKHPTMAWLLHRLGVVRLVLGDHAGAEPPLREALAVADEAEVEPEDLAQCLYDLACAYGALREPEKAEPLFKRALSVLQDVYGPDHPSRARIVETMRVVLEFARQEDRGGTEE